MSDGPAKSISTDIKSDFNDVVINDILCYITTAANKKSNDFIINSCIAFYDINKIKEAKVLLCSYNDERANKRRGDDAKKAELQDIIDIF